MAKKYNYSYIKTYLFNLLYYKTIIPKIYLGKKTKIINNNGILQAKKCFFDCRNKGQFFYNSHIIINKNAQLLIGTNVNFYSGAQIKAFENAVIEIDNETFFSGPIVLHSKKHIKIGKKCKISWNVTIIDSDFHPTTKNNIVSKKVVIEDNVWIGANSTILKGVTIPSGSIIAAGSVVTKSLIQKGIYAGNPAKLIKVL